MSNRRKANLRGILVATVTPFTNDGSEVDEAMIRVLADRYVAAGIHGFVPTGTTGEFSTLSPAEYRRVMRAWIDAAAGRVPVIPGVGSLSTPGAIELAQHAEQAGATAIMLVPPFYGALPWEGLKAFLRAVAGSISIPIVYYNVPSATGVKLNAAQLAELGDIEGVDYLKDSSGDAVTLADLIASRGDRIKAFNGWDTLTFFGIASGAEASVWGAANVVPELCVALWDALAEQRDLARARAIWRHLWAICDFLESVDYVAGVKAGMELVGQPVGPARLPILPLSAADRERFARILQAATAFAVPA